MQRGVLALAAVAAFWTLPAIADPAIPQDVFVTTQGEGQYLAKDLLLGAKVHNKDGAIIGDVEDLILNANNQVEGVILGVGGFAGFGEKRVGVALPALQIKNESGVVIVSLPEATKETLDALPAFERKQPPKSLIDRAIEKAKELSDKSSVTAKDAYEKAKEEAGPALQRAEEAAKKTYEESVKPALDKAGEATKEAYDAAKDAMAPKPEATPAETPPAAEAPKTEAAPAAPAETPAETPPAEAPKDAAPAPTP
ncbi:PRC-barrel domain-containing protein [Hyphomicrobium sp. NDB2Meth4]|uniref:PRC-barrel domain-containing protein n=1 Tax=Hyphomicrobium sp. NDB2Meth4 TaxID=1892846 RepID=UPI0009FAB95A|nr:PRC-barrel domain-containing protein [Hyphomicrobium sp. NDB2Meth4]